MSLIEYVNAHPWWTLIYLALGGGLLVEALRALRGR